MRQDGIFIHQKIRETGTGSGTGNIYNNYGVDKEILDKLLAAKDEEIQILKDESQSQKEEIKYLKEKVDQLLGLVGKK
jgi:hypothetical protein